MVSSSQLDPRVLGGNATQKHDEKDEVILGLARSQARLRFLHTWHTGSRFILLMNTAEYTSNEELL